MVEKAFFLYKIKNKPAPAYLNSYLYNNNDNNNKNNDNSNNNNNNNNSSSNNNNNNNNDNNNNDNNNNDTNQAYSTRLSQNETLRTFSSRSD